MSTQHSTARTVLVVDDDEDMRLYLRLCLRWLGPLVGQVIEAADGLEALDMIRTVRVDLVITDVVMPGLNGYELCQALKNDTALAGIPVIFISGETRAPPPCADGFVAKPFNTESLRTYLLPWLYPPPLTL